MSLYEYKPKDQAFLPARPLAAFSIESVMVEDKRIVALGSLSFTDFSVEAEDPDRHVSLEWQADNYSVDGVLMGWGVFHIKKIRPASPTVMVALQKLVSTELDLYIGKHPEVLSRSAGNGSTPPSTSETAPAPTAEITVIPLPPEPIRVIIPVKEYNGPHESYEGDCVCRELEESGPRNPFDWAGKTGCAFPERCFECSCGKLWWCNRPLEQFWVIVADRRAWEMLCRYDGVPTVTLAYEDDAVYLEETLISKRSGRPYHLHVK
jgi:hypothetical protein